jgi:hypothetical protein
MSNQDTLNVPFSPHLASINPLRDYLHEATTSVIWHFHALKNGRIILVNPLRKTRLCQEEGRCVLISVNDMQVLRDYHHLGCSDPQCCPRQIFGVGKDGATDIAPGLRGLNTLAEEHDLDVAPESKV